MKIRRTSKAMKKYQNENTITQIDLTKFILKCQITFFKKDEYNKLHYCAHK